MWRPQGGSARSSFLILPRRSHMGDPAGWERWGASKMGDRHTCVGPSGAGSRVQGTSGVRKVLERLGQATWKQGRS